MCGIIFGVINNKFINNKNNEIIENIFNHARIKKSRGPDNSIFVFKKKFKEITIYYGFHRLIIQGDRNVPPSFIENDRFLLLCNGEVYPSDKFKDKYKPHEIKGQSDCEWILETFNSESETNNIKDTTNTTDLLSHSEFALIIFDKIYNNVYIYRDNFGIRPLYMSRINKHIHIYTSSLNYIPKNILRNNMNFIEQVPTNKWLIIKSVIEYDNDNNDNNINYNVYDFNTKDIINNRKRKYSFVKNDNNEDENDNNEDENDSNEKSDTSLTTSLSLDDFDIKTDNIYKYLYEAVYDRINYCDAEIGFLLSGGLDSSIICALASRILNKKIKTFSIGLSENATDIIAAREVAKFINSEHTSIILDKNKFIEELPNVIRISETWDVTTIRAGTGMYLLSKYIRKNTNIKVILTGEGSDELFGSYRYFLNAPDPESHKQESLRLLQDLKYFDVLRCDRTISNNGLEARVPFLDSRLTNYVKNNFNGNDYIVKDGMLKPHLRNVAKKYNLLPDSISYRPKEAFSDGISTNNEESWHQILTNQFINYKSKQPIYKYKGTTKTNEAKYYKDIFDSYYPNCSCLIPYPWLPKWCGNHNDPSARQLTVKEKNTLSTN